MKKLFDSVFFSRSFAPEGEGAGAGDPPADPGSLLFPNDKQDGDDKSGEGDKSGDGDKTPADWKEYISDPNKTATENAAAKAEHDKTKPEAKADDKNKAVADQVPADGKYVLTMPEGVEVDAELLAEIGPEFKDAGLTNGQAQKLADKFVKVQQERAAKQAEGWANTITKWADDAKADKEIGGDKWDGTVLSAHRAVDKLGTPELKEYLNASGGGNHPELIRFMSKVGEMIREDNPASGGAGGKGQPAEPAHVLFPTDAPKG